MKQPSLTETADPFCLDRADAVALLAGAPWRGYAVIGDSLSAGTGDPTPGYRDQGWSDRRQPEIVRGLASEYGAIVVDMWDHPVNDRDSLLSEDRIHFSTSGQAIMAAEMIKQLARSLGRTPSA